MPDRRIYTLSIPAGVQESASTDLRRQLATSGTVTPGPAQAESIATDPDERRLEGHFGHETFGPILAAEFEELFGAADVGAVPYVVVGAEDPRDGYYELGSQCRVEPGHPADDAIWRFRNARLTRVGSRRSHWRAVRTNQEFRNDYDFGSTETAAVGIPAAASKVRWFDAETGAREEATATTTRTGEFGDVDVYDADASSFAAPTLIYDVAYADDARADLRVWDTRGTADRDDADGTPQWQMVFDPSHDYVGVPAVSNKLLRLTFDEPNNSLSAERWGAGSSAWTSQSLGTSDWELFDVDVYYLGVERVEAQVEFRDPTQSPTAFHSLDMRLWRGGADAQWVRTRTDKESATAPPQGLQDLLAPIATSNTMSARADAGLVGRSEARK